MQICRTCISLQADSGPDHTLTAYKYRFMRFFTLFAATLFITTSFSQSITLLSKDPKVKSLWLNVWRDENQVDPNLCRFGTDYKVMSQDIPGESIRISVNEPIKIIKNELSLGWSFVYTFQAGDSIDITMGKDDMPLFTVRNRPGKLYETNLEYFLNLSGRAANIISEPKTVAAYQQKREHYYRFFDSLHTAQLISDSFYLSVMDNRVFLDEVSLIGFNRSRKMPMKEADFKNIPLFEDSLLKYSAYPAYVNTYIQTFRLPAGPVNRKTQHLRDLQFFNYCLQEGKGMTREKLLFKSLLRINEFARPSFDSCFKKYQQVSLSRDNEQLLLSLKSKADQDKQFTASSTSLKDPLFANNADTPVAFQDLLKKHKGKVIYVDFWASWCGPCIAEMKPAEALKEKLTGQPFVLVSISVDEKLSAWKTAAAKYLNGNPESYILGNPKKSSLVTQLKIATIPRYLLIDKTGKIVNKDAPRPGEERLMDDIKALLR